MEKIEQNKTKGDAERVVSNSEFRHRAQRARVQEQTESSSTSAA